MTRYFRQIAGRPHEVLPIERVEFDGEPIGSVEVDQVMRRLDEPVRDGVFIFQRAVIISVVLMLLALAAALIYLVLP